MQASWVRSASSKSQPSCLPHYQGSAWHLPWARPCSGFPGRSEEIRTPPLSLRGWLSSPPHPTTHQGTPAPGSLPRPCLHLQSFSLGSSLRWSMHKRPLLQEALPDHLVTFSHLSPCLYLDSFIHLSAFGCSRSLLLGGLCSSCGESGLLSCCRAQALGHADFSSGSSGALEHRLNSCDARA